MVKNSEQLPNELLSDEEFSQSALAAYQNEQEDLDSVGKQRNWAKINESLEKSYKINSKKNDYRGALSVFFGVAAVILFTVISRLDNNPSADRNIKGGAVHIPIEISAFQIETNNEFLPFAPDIGAKVGQTFVFKLFSPKTTPVAILTMNDPGGEFVLVNRLSIEAGKHEFITEQDQYFAYQWEESDQFLKICAMAIEAIDQPIETFNPSELNIPEVSCASLLRKE